MDRLTEKYKNGVYGWIKSMFDFANAEKLGKLEDLMEKYEIESIEALEEILKDYDAMAKDAKDIVELGLGIKDKIKRVLTPFLNAVITAEEDEWIKVEIETIVYDMLDMQDKCTKTTLERWAELLKIDGGNTKHQVLVDLEKFINKEK